MSRRVTLIILGAIALAVFSHLVRSYKPTTAPEAQIPRPAASGPLPAGSPTAVPSGRSSRSRHKQYKPRAPAKNDYEFGGLGHKFQTHLARIVKISASWPGTVSKQKLIQELKGERPLLTDEALDRIVHGWNTSVMTFKLKVKDVNLDPAMSTAPDDPNTATLAAYVTLVKHFTPVAAQPYNQTSTLSYTMRLRVIKRKWRVIAVTPQTSAPSTGG